MSLTASNGTMYLLSRGISIQWVGYLGTVGVITILLFEFPTGLIADRLGSGTSVAVSLIVRGIAAFLTIFCYGPFLFSIITIMHSVGATCYSGAAEAWIFSRDSTIKHNMANFFSNIFFLTGASKVLGGWLGAFLGSIELRIPFVIASAILVLISTLFIFYDMITKEKYINKMNKREKSIIRILLFDAKNSFAFMKKEKDIFWLMISGVFFIIFCSIPLVYWQPFFYNTVQSIKSLGWIWVGFIFFNMCGNLFVKSKTLQKINDIHLFWITICLCGITLLLSAVLDKNFLISVFFFCSYQLFLGILGPIRAKILNRKISDANRASILSLISFSESAGSIFSLSLFGYLSSFMPLHLIFGLSTVPLVFALIIAMKIAYRFKFLEGSANTHRVNLINY
ncbi:MAG: MFS transporter [Proteobacteria bacterium]|nr:MFS transporter [Pseudomonadota bacterium]